MLRSMVLLAAAAMGAVTVAVMAAETAAPAPVGDRLLMRTAAGPAFAYAHGGTLVKPYVKELFSPAGVNVLLDSPSDHIHHHGLMFALAADGVDFWAEQKVFGRQRSVRFGELSPRRDGATLLSGLAETLDWIAPKDPKPLVREAREVEVAADPALGATLVTWRSRVEAAPGRASVKLTGSHYFGLGMRFIRSMDNAGPFFTAKGPVDGEVVRGDERLTPGTWCAYTAAADGKPVTVAMFDHPKNPRPALWFTMGKPFAYLAATMNLHREPMTLEAAKPLSLVYGVAVWDGKVEAAAIEKLYRRWLDLAAPTNP